MFPGLGRSPGEENGYPLQYSGLENSTDYTVHGGRKESDMTERLSLPLSSTFFNVAFVLVAVGLWFLCLSVCPLMEEAKRLV